MFVLGQETVDVRRACDIRIIISMFQYHSLLESVLLFQYAWHTNATYIDGRKLFAMLSTCSKNEGGFLIRVGSRGAY